MSDELGSASPHQLSYTGTRKEGAELGSRGRRVCQMDAFFFFFWRFPRSSEMMSPPPGPWPAVLCSLCFCKLAAILHAGERTPFPLLPVAITNKVRMTQQEVCVCVLRRKGRNPTGLSRETGYGRERCLTLRCKSASDLLCWTTVEHTRGSALQKEHV